MVEIGRRNKKSSKSIFFWLVEGSLSIGCNLGSECSECYYALCIVLLGDRDPPDSCKCKKVSGTKMAEQKQWNKNGRTKIIHYSELPKQKLVGTVQVQKGQQNKNWWVEQKKRSVEQKLVSGTKMAEQKLLGGTKKRSAEQKLVSGTKIGEQNKNGRTMVTR